MWAQLKKQVDILYLNQHQLKSLTPVSTNEEVVEETLQVSNSGRGENLWQFLDHRVSESSSRHHPTTTTTMPGFNLKII